MSTPRSEIGHGQLWWADLDGDKVRPVLVLTRAWIAPRLTRILVAPITTTIRNIPTEVALDTNEGLGQPSVVNLDNAQLLTIDRLLDRIGSVAPERWPEVCTAMARVMAC